MYVYNLILIINKNEGGSWSDEARPTNDRLRLLAGCSQERRGKGRRSKMRGVKRGMKRRRD